MAPVAPQSQPWPADRALLLVHGVGNARPGDYDPLLAQVREILEDQPKPYAIYVLYYDAINSWFAAKLQAAQRIDSLVGVLRSKLPVTKLGNVFADFAGDVIWPILSLNARDAVRTALVQQLQQIVLDGKAAKVRQPAQHLSIIAHSLGCFHVFETLHYVARNPAEGLGPATAGVQFDNVIFMASPVQLISTVAGAIRSLVPQAGDLACLAPGTLDMPKEDNGAGQLIPSARQTVSITGNLDPVGGHLFRKRLDWAFMALPSQIPLPVDQQDVFDITETDLETILQQSLREQDPPSIAPQNPHDWSAYVARHANDLRTWLNV